MEKETCLAAWLGPQPYDLAWSMQEKLAGEVASGQRKAAFMLLEHPHTFTAGRSTKPGHLLWDEAERNRKGVKVYEVDRGGDITYHGPGQLVGYPIFQLEALPFNPENHHGADVVGFVRKIEQALILALAEFGISGCQRGGFTGVWVKPERNEFADFDQNAKKIASIGVKVDVNRVTRHGFALNVDPDMNYWNGIIACGLEGVAMTSMADCLGSKPDMNAVVGAVLRSFAAIFNLEIILDHSF